MNKERNTVGFNQRYVGFLGLDNSNDPVKFGSGEGAVKLSVAENVNVQRNMSVSRRDGYSLWKAGQYKSLWGNGVDVYAVKANGINGDLVKLDSNKVETVIRSNVVNLPMEFVDARNGYIYYTNGLLIGKIKNGISYSLTNSSDQFKGTLPPGSFLSYLSPRILVVRDNVIYISDAVNRDVYHQHTGFIQFDTTIRMVAPVGQNLFVSDSRYTWFLTKMQPQLDIPSPMFQLKKVASYPAIAGNPFAVVEGIKTEMGYYADAAMWISENGVCIGGSDGMFENLTDKKYKMPSVMRSACVDNVTVGDLNLFISVIKGIK